MRGSQDLLRLVLRVDGWSTAVFGVVLLALAGPLSPLLGLPVSWAVPFGVAMLGGAAALGLLAAFPRIPARFAVMAVAGNGLSAVSMVALAFSPVLPLTGLGVAFVLVGAVTVGVYAGLEYAGLRRSRAA
ncbi:hypothetical protein [Nonomuraea typhae]|uniref:Integral membrane protein n=1 Tax=Nonomuraea typhae TaxID=2603600 RepID=A0ABW7Z549_9ACTN